MTEDLSDKIRQMRYDGMLLGEIAHAIDWPHSLDRMRELVADIKQPLISEVSPRGPVFRAHVGNV